MKISKVFFLIFLLVINFTFLNLSQNISIKDGKSLILTNEEIDKKKKKKKKIILFSSLSASIVLGIIFVLSYYKKDAISHKFEKLKGLDKKIPCPTKNLNHPRDTNALLNIFSNLEKSPFSQPDGEIPSTSKNAPYPKGRYNISFDQPLTKNNIVNKVPLKPFNAFVDVLRLKLQKHFEESPYLIKKKFFLDDSYIRKAAQSLQISKGLQLSREQEDMAVKKSKLHLQNVYNELFIL